MTLNPPRKVRAAIYIFTTLASLVVAYLSTKGLIGADEVSLWLQLSAATTALAGINTAK